MLMKWLCCSSVKLASFPVFNLNGGHSISFENTNSKELVSGLEPDSAHSISGFEG